MSIFEYGFMQRAFLVGILLAVITPLIGMTVVLKRMSMVEMHWPMLLSRGSDRNAVWNQPGRPEQAVSVWWQRWQLRRFRRRLPRYSENAIAIVMSAGIGLAGVLSGFVKNSANFKQLFVWKYRVNQHSGTFGGMCCQRSGTAASYFISEGTFFI